MEIGGWDWKKLSPVLRELHQHAHPAVILRSAALLSDIAFAIPSRERQLSNLAGGTLRQGSIADVTVFDPAAQWIVDPTRFRSKGRNTPYAGQRLRGRVAYTIVDGRVVHRRDA